MVSDERTSREPVNGTVEIAAADASLNTLIDLDAGETYALDTIRLQYLESGTEEAVVEVYDLDDDADLSDATDPVDRLVITAGETVEDVDTVWSDFENGVTLLTNGDNDAPIHATVGGHIITR